MDKPRMRPIIALSIYACLAACSVAPTPVDQSYLFQDEARQRQAALDVQAIIEGMTQARNRAEAMARSAR